MKTVDKSRLLSQSKQWSLIFARSLMDDFYEAMIKKLDELVDKAEANQQQYFLLTELANFKKKRQDITEEFQVALQLYFDRFVRREIVDETAPVVSSSSALSIMAEEDVEQDIAESTLIKKVETEHSEILYLLHERLNFLTGNPIPVEASPLGPKQLAQFFEQSLKCAKLEKKMHMLFYKVFEVTLLQCIGNFYKELNQVLTDASILPGLRYSSAHNKNTNNRSNDDDPSGGSSGHEEFFQPEIPPAYQQPQYADTAPRYHYQGQNAGGPQNYQQPVTAQQNPVYAPTQTGGYPQTAINSNASGFYQRENLVSAINQVQNVAITGAHVSAGSATAGYINMVSDFQQLAPGKIQPCSIQSVETVVNMINEGNPEQDITLVEDDVNTIDLVGMIFEYMLNDEQLPDSVKSLLSYLHVPFIKVALLEPAMFGQVDHPARQLLNKLSEAGTLWLNKEGYGQFKVFDKIKEVVNRAINDSGRDNEVFIELLQDFSIFMRKVEKSVAQIEKNSVQQLEAEKKLERVKALVHSKIKAKIHEESLPSSIAALILYPWFDYLTFIMLRFGEDSEQWRQGFQVIDNILWSIKPKKRKEEVSRLKHLKIVLHKQISKAFEVVGYDYSKGVDLLNRLGELQQLAIQNTRLEEVVTKEDVVEIKKMKKDTAKRESVAAPPDLKLMTDDEKNLVEKLKLIEFGTWFEIQDLQSKEAKKLKLAWFNNQDLSYLFVNAAGNKESTMTALEIARLMLANLARIVAGSAKPFFERALETIYSNMSRKVTSTAAMAE